MGWKESNGSSLADCGGGFGTGSRSAEHCLQTAGNPAYMINGMGLDRYFYDGAETRGDEIR